MILGLDIGGTKLSAALMDGTTIFKSATAATPTYDRGPESVTEAALNLLRPFLSREHNATAIGVAATGSVRAGKVTALNSDTLRGWHDYDLQTALREATQLPVNVLNDADAAAWGEAVAGAGRGVRDFIFATISTGVGGGLVLGGQLYLTPNGQQAELGYTLTERGEPIELVASGGALDRWAKLRNIDGAPGLVAEANMGNAQAKEKLNQSAELVAFKLADLHLTLGISLAVIGGGLGLSSGYLKRVRDSLDGLGEPWAKLKLAPAQLGANAGLVGAADWASRMVV